MKCEFCGQEILPLSSGRKTDTGGFICESCMEKYNEDIEGDDQDDVD